MSTGIKCETKDTHSCQNIKIYNIINIFITLFRIQIHFIKKFTKIPNDKIIELNVLWHKSNFRVLY